MIITGGAKKANFNLTVCITHTMLRLDIFHRIFHISLKYNMLFMTIIISSNSYFC